MNKQRISFFRLQCLWGYTPVVISFHCRQHIRIFLCQLIAGRNFIVYRKTKSTRIAFAVQKDTVACHRCGVQLGSLGIKQVIPENRKCKFIIQEFPGEGQVEALIKRPL